MWGYFGDILHVLPMHASPGNSLVHLGHRDFSEIGLDLRTDESLLVISGTCLHIFGFDRSHVSKGYFYQFVRGKQITPP